MLNNLRNRLISGWSFMRFIRLGLALIIIAEALNGSEIMFAFLGSFLLFQAVFNYGCCGVSGCDINFNNNKPKILSAGKEEITFKEVK